MGTKASIKNKEYDLQEIFYEGLGNVIGARVSIWIAKKLGVFGWFKDYVKIGIDAATGFLITYALKAVFVIPKPTKTSTIPAKTYLVQRSGR